MTWTFRWLLSAVRVRPFLELIRSSFHRTRARRFIPPMPAWSTGPPRNLGLLAKCRARARTWAAFQCRRKGSDRLKHWYRESRNELALPLATSRATDDCHTSEFTDMTTTGVRLTQERRVRT